MEMFWYLIFVLMLVTGIVFLVLEHEGYGWAFDFWGFMSLIVGIIGILATIWWHVGVTKFVDTYPQTKAFYESVTPGSEYEDATFKLEKAEMNRNLFSAQWSKENMPFFSLYPDEVLDLEPIQ